MNKVHFEQGSEHQERPKFVPKRRAPYLMQKEIIDLKKQEAEKQEAAQDLIIQKEKEESGLLVVNRKSNGSQYKITRKQNNAKERAQDKEVIKESINPNIPLENNYHEKVTRLYGLQKKIIHYFVQCCITRQKTTTGPVTSETLCSVVKSTHKTIKKIIQRLEENNLITRHKGKRGKGGFAIFELEQELIDVMRLQAELEHNHFAINATQNNGVHTKSINNLPDDWENIDLTLLYEAFQLASTKVPQYFGKAQIKVIFSQAGKKLTSKDIQESIFAFSFGLKYLLGEEPYKSMDNPAAILLNKLKNGERWFEKRYLSNDEIQFYRIYINLSNQIQTQIQNYFEKWKQTDKKQKYNYYESKMRSNEFFDERVFHEKAWDDFTKNLWPLEKKKIVSELMGISDENRLAKFQYLFDQNIII